MTWCLNKWRYYNPFICNNGSILLLLQEGNKSDLGSFYNHCLFHRLITRMFMVQCNGYTTFNMDTQHTNTIHTMHALPWHWNPCFPNPLLIWEKKNTHINNCTTYQIKTVVKYTITSSRLSTDIYIIQSIWNVPNAILNKLTHVHKHNFTK